MAYANTGTTANAGRANNFFALPLGPSGGTDSSTNGRNFTASATSPGVSGPDSILGGVKYFSLADPGTGGLHTIVPGFYVCGFTTLTPGEWGVGATAAALLSKWNDTASAHSFVIQAVPNPSGNPSLLMAVELDNGGGTISITSPEIDLSLNGGKFFWEAFINPGSPNNSIIVCVNRGVDTGLAYANTKNILVNNQPYRIGQTADGASNGNQKTHLILDRSTIPSTTVRDFYYTEENPFAQDTPPPDITVPVINSGTVNSAGTQITLSPSETLVLHGATAAGFQLTGCVGDEVLSGLALSGGNLVLTVTPALAGGMLPKIAYTGTLITDVAGNQLATFSAGSFTITNNSTALITSPSTGNRLSKALRNKLATYAVNKRTVPGGAVAYTAANAYPISLLDIYLAWRVDPTFMSDGQWSAYLSYLLTHKDGSNNVPIFQFDSVTPGVYDQLIFADGYNQDTTGHVPPAYKAVGDGTWCIPILLKYLYDRTGSLTLWNAHKAGILVLLAGRDIDPGGSGLIYANADAIPDYGFHDGLHLTGKKLDGSVMAYRANGDAAALCTASGDASAATACTTRRNLIATNIGQLRDSATGLYFACSDSANLDIYFSALAVEFGLVTGSNAVGVANGLNTALSSIVDSATGFLYQTIGNWVSGTMRPDNPFGGNGYYDGGGWLFEAKPVLSLLGTVNLVGAYAIVDQILAGSNPTREWVRKASLSSGPTGGKEGNLANMPQVWGAIVALDALSSAGTVATPTFAPPAGAVALNTVVTASSATSGSDTGVTGDGSTPDASDPDTFTVTGAVTLKAKSFKVGLTDSAVATAAYTVVISDVMPPTIAFGGLAADGVTVPFTLSEAGNQGVNGLSSKVNGVNRNLTVVWDTATQARVLLGAPVYPDEALVLAYTPLGGDIADLAGNEMESFTNRAITNESEQERPVVLPSVLDVTITSIKLKNNQSTYYLRGREELTLVITAMADGAPYDLETPVVSLSHSAPDSPFPPKENTFVPTDVKDDLEATWFIGDNPPGGMAQIQLPEGRRKLWVRLGTATEDILKEGPIVTVIA